MCGAGLNGPNIISLNIILIMSPPHDGDSVHNKIKIEIKRK